LQEESPDYQWESLVKYVQSHVEIMLRKLYVEIIKVEEHPSVPVTNHSSEPQVNAIELKWLKHFYAQSDGRVRIVGPLGERPLHVCALAIDRFGPFDFQGKGNYLSTGIVEGILAFANNIQSFVKAAYDDKRPDLLTYFQKEVTAQYGKDYCAILGSYLLKLDDGPNPPVVDPFKDRDAQPPYWEQISTWYKAHMSRRGFLKPPERFSRVLVSTGMFEGETILFALIAGQHLDAIDKLLEWQQNISKSGEKTSGNAAESPRCASFVVKFRFSLPAVAAASRPSLCAQFLAAGGAGPLLPPDAQALPHVVRGLEGMGALHQGALPRHQPGGELPALLLRAQRAGVCRQVAPWPHAANRDPLRPRTLLERRSPPTTTTTCGSRCSRTMSQAALVTLYRLDSRYRSNETDESGRRVRPAWPPPVRSMLRRAAAFAPAATGRCRVRAGHSVAAAPGFTPMCVG
jgi:hypothetical protein